MVRLEITKTHWLSIMTLFFTSLSVLAKDIPANNCEIFVDKFSLSYCSYSMESITIYVKTLNDRLDGAIVEAGFRKRSTYSYPPNSSDQSFIRVPITKVGGNNYFAIQLGTARSNELGGSHEGTFYVTTDKGTTYWATPAEAGNFTFDYSLYSMLASLTQTPVFCGSQASVSTQMDKLRTFNPGTCY